MARSGKNLKITGRRVRQKQKDVKRQIEKVQSSDVKGKWDTTQTLRQNYKRLGLGADPNTSIKQSEVEVGELTKEWKDVDTEGNISGHGQAAERKRPYHCSEEECNYIRPLIEKHQDDMTAMFRSKLNYLQETKAKLSRRVTRYNLFIQHNSDMAELETAGGGTGVRSKLAEEKRAAHRRAAIVAKANASLAQISQEERMEGDDGSENEE